MTRTLRVELLTSQVIVCDIFVMHCIRAQSMEPQDRILKKITAVDRRIKSGVPTRPTFV